MRVSTICCVITILQGLLRNEESRTNQNAREFGTTLLYASSSQKK
jgi:hypothetical protein